MEGGIPEVRYKANYIAGNFGGVGHSTSVHMGGILP